MLSRCHGGNLKSFSTIHSSAEKGFQAAGAALYNKGRPTYPRLSISAALNLIPNTTDNLSLIELGAGTGKFTTALLDHLLADNSDVGKRRFATLQLRAVEPSGFREALNEAVMPYTQRQIGYAAALNVTQGSINSYDGTGEAIPATDSSVDAVIAAQAFHWMASEQTLREVHRVLKPHYPLLLLWNTYDYSYSWLRQVDEQVLTPAYQSAAERTGTHLIPRQQTGEWTRCFHSVSGKQLFQFPQQWEDSGDGLKVDHVGDRQLIINRIMSTSVLAELDQHPQLQAEKEMYRDRLEQILDAHPELEGARSSGEFVMPYVTDVVWATSRKQE